MNIKVDNKKAVLITIGVVALLAGVFGATYAWFDSKVENPNGSSINITTANLGTITFEDGPEINLPDMYPGTTEIKEFTIARTEANSNSEIFYQVVLHVTVNTLTDVADGEFIYSLSGTKTGDGTLIFVSDQIVPKIETILGTGSLVGNETHTYTFEITLNETGSNQNATRGMGFSGYLQVEGGDNLVRINTKLDGVRYIKDCINGNTVNAGNHWVELQAIRNGENVALGDAITGTSSENSSYPYSRITDGDITPANYATSINSGLQCITVDLNRAYDLELIKVWHYYSGGRTYYNNTTYVSSNGSTWTPVIANTDAETNLGKRVTAYEPNNTLVPVFKYPNILSNSDFSSSTTTSVAWDNSLNRNPAIVPTGWSSGYNGGVTAPSTGYHARFDNAPFGYNVMVFPNLNSIISMQNRWLGITQGIVAGTITPNTTYVVTMDVYDNAVNHRINGGIYHYNTSTGTNVFGTAIYDFSTTSDNLNKWVTRQAVFTTPSTLSTTNTTTFYVYGYNGTEGTAYVKNIYLVKQ